MLCGMLCGETVEWPTSRVKKFLKRKQILTIIVEIEIDDINKLDDRYVHNIFSLSFLPLAVLPHTLYGIKTDFHPDKARD